MSVKVSAIQSAAALVAVCAPRVDGRDLQRAAKGAGVFDINQGQ
jgi:hypothetical protein